MSNCGVTTLLARSPDPQLVTPRWLVVLIFLLASFTAVAEDPISSRFCDVPPYDSLCSILPQDNTDFDASFIYHSLEKNAQNPFDVFSWQTFVTLNWPADSDGDPVDKPIGSRPALPRVWQFYKQPAQVFALTQVSEACAPASPPTLITGQFLQSSGKPLIDRDLNFVVFDTRMNGQSELYIVRNGLHTLAGQRKFTQAGKVIDFNRGYYENKANRTGGAPGAIELKTAWKIIDRESEKERDSYYVIDGFIAVPAASSVMGRAMCIEVRLGLIGMHIMHRTSSGNGGDWIWSTFEHVDAAPIASNALNPNNILGELFAGGCRAENAGAQRYILFNQDCEDCITNTIKVENWKWSERKPYAQQHAIDGRFGTQVVRCWEIFESTANVNDIWRAKLNGTVWSNYQLISTQWRGAAKSAVFPNGEVPRYLTNVTLETYDQYSHDGTCIGCHAKAVTLTGQNANFSFFLSKAK